MAGSGSAGQVKTCDQDRDLTAFGTLCMLGAWAGGSVGTRAPLLRLGWPQHAGRHGRSPCVGLDVAQPVSLSVWATHATRLNEPDRDAAALGRHANMR